MKDFIKRTINSIKWIVPISLEYTIIVLVLTAVWQVLEIFNGKVITPRSSDSIMVLVTGLYILYLRRAVRKNGQRNKAM
jgi:hypothetical protein